MSYSHEWGTQRKKSFGPAPWGPGEGSKGQISFNFNYKVNFKDFYSKLCVCSHKWKIQNISDGFFILSPGSCPRGGTWWYLGAKIKFRPAVCPLCYFLLNHWTKFNQIWCESYSHEWGVQRKKKKLPRPLGPWGGVKRSNIINSNYKVNFKDFYSKLCVCSHKWKIQNISDRFFILSPGSCRRGRTLGHWGCPGGNKIFFKHGHVAYQIDGDNEQNKMQATFSS